MSRPVLLAMNNPLSTNPRYALAPFPVGASGYRLWAMLNDVRPTCRREYMDAFDRRNLVTGPWSRGAARQAVRELELSADAIVVVLGDKVRQALELERCLVHTRHSPNFPEGPAFRQLPHPSGRNLWYNHPTNRLLAGLLLAELMGG